MRVLVLGGQGFIGYNLCKRLLTHKHEVKVFDYSNNKDRELPTCEYIYGDFNRIEEYSYMFENVDIVFHLICTMGAEKSNQYIIKDIEENVINTLKILDLCKDNKIKKVIYASSGGTVYGIPNNVPIKENDALNPICAYGISKVSVEKYLSLYNFLYSLDYSVLRLANPYGPYHSSNSQGLINIYLKKIINNENVEIWGDGKIKRDYIFIDDVIDAFIISMNITSETKVFNIGSGNAIDIHEIIEKLKEVTNLEPLITYKEGRSVDVPINELDIALAKKILNWEPKCSLEMGIRETYENLRETQD